MPGKQKYKIISFQAEAGLVEYEAVPIDIGGPGKTIAVVIPAACRECFRDRRLRVRLQVIGEEK